MGDRNERFEEQKVHYRRRLSDELYERAPIAILDEESSEALSSSEDEEFSDDIQVVAPPAYRKPSSIVEQPVRAHLNTQTEKSHEKIASNSDSSESDDELDDEEIASTRARLRDLKNRHLQQYPKK